MGRSVHKGGYENIFATFWLGTKIFCKILMGYKMYFGIISMMSQIFILPAVLNLQNCLCRLHSPVSKSGSYLPFYLKKNLGEGESWYLFSNQQMGLKVQKNLGLIMLTWSEKWFDHVNVIRKIFLRKLFFIWCRVFDVWLHL